MREWCVSQPRGVGLEESGKAIKEFCDASLGGCLL